MSHGGSSGSSSLTIPKQSRYYSESDWAVFRNEVGSIAFWVRRLPLNAPYSTIQTRLRAIFLSVRYFCCSYILVGAVLGDIAPELCTGLPHACVRIRTRPRVYSCTRLFCKYFSVINLKSSVKSHAEPRSARRFL